MGRVFSTSMLRPAARIAAMVTAFGFAAPALGQGGFPPVPGPFPVNPMAVAPVAPAAQAMAMPVPATPARPLFQPPENALRMPYWLQAAPGSTVQTAPDADTADTAEAAAQPQAAPVVRYAQPAQAGATVTQGYQAGGYAGAGYGVAGGWQQPGWGYGAPPGWAPTPYAPQPGWGGAWSQPAMSGVR